MSCFPGVPGNLPLNLAPSLPPKIILASPKTKKAVFNRKLNYRQRGRGRGGGGGQKPNGKLIFFALLAKERILVTCIKNSL